MVFVILFCQNTTAFPMQIAIDCWLKVRQIKKATHLHKSQATIIIFMHFLWLHSENKSWNFRRNSSLFDTRYKYTFFFCHTRDETVNVNKSVICDWVWGQKLEKYTVDGMQSSYWNLKTLKSRNIKESEIPNLLRIFFWPFTDESCILFNIFFGLSSLL